MGKIYDALKKAEREAKTSREKHHSSYNRSPLEVREHQESITTPAPAAPDKTVNDAKDSQKKPGPIASEPKKIFSPALFKRIENTKATKLTSTNLFLLKDPHSVAAEQFRILRSLVFNFNKSHNLRTILITSCLPEEGKSTVSSNLAICIARSVNQYTLLVDCDLRKPSIHKIFDLNGGPGLSDYLNQDITLSQTLNKTEIDKLTIIPAGNHPDNPSELLSSEKMKHLVQEVKAKYNDRYIIFDSTPVNQTSEPAILAEQVDGIILVVRAGKTDRELAARTVDHLGKEKILGVVFNMAQEPIKSRYYNYNYYYSQEK